MNALDFFRVINKLESKFLESTKKLQIVISFVFVSQLVPFLLLDPYSPGTDSVLIVDGTSNILASNGYSNGILWVFEKGDGLDKFAINKPAYLYPPLTSFLLLPVFYLSESIVAGMVFQFLLFIFLVVFYWKLVCSMFNDRIALYSVIFVALNPILFIEVFSPIRTHILGLLLFVLYLYYDFTSTKMNSDLSIDNKKSYSNFIILGFLGSLAYLSRDIYLILVFVWIFTYLLKQQYQNLSYYLLGFLPLTLLWWHRNYKYFSTINARGNIVGFEYPLFDPALEISTNLFAYQPDIMKFAIGFFRLIGALPSYELFFILFPFVVLGILRQVWFRKRLDYMLVSFSIIGVSVLSPLLAGDAGYQTIYVLGAFLILLPIGLDNLDWISKSVSNFDGARNVVFVTIVAVMLLCVCLYNAGFLYQKVEHRLAQEPYRWEQDFFTDFDTILATRDDARGLYFYTQSPVINMPTNLNETNLLDLIKIYNIRFIYINQDTSYFYNTDVTPYSDLFSCKSNIIYSGIEMSRLNYENIEDNFCIYEIQS